MREISQGDKSGYLADFSMLAVTAVWGLSFTVLKSVLGQHISIMIFIFSRFLVAAIFLFPFCIRRMKNLDRTGFVGGIGVGILIFLGFTLQSYGIEHTTASRAAFITGLASIFVPVYTLLLQRKLPSAINAIAVIVAMLGMYFLTGPAAGGFNRGDFLVLLCAFSFAGQIYVLGILSRGRDPLPLTFLQLATTMFLAGVFLPIEKIRFDYSTNTIGAIIFLGIFATGAALLTQTWAQKKTSPIKIGLILTAEPLFAYMFASAILDDYFNPIQKIGGAVIIAAVLSAEVLPLVIRKRISKNR